MAGFYITLTGLPAGFYTDNFFVDLSDDWTVAQFLAEVQDEIGDPGGSYELRKEGVALTSTDKMADAAESGDTIALVAL